MKQFLSPVLIAIPLFLHAHLPRIVSADSTFIQQAEVSQAFYAELKGEEHVYMLRETDSFDLYLQLLTPDLPGQRTDFLVNIFQNSENLSGNRIYSADTKEFQWTKYYEPYGGDHYLKGPEFRAKAAPGTYRITISNNGNTGKYALAIGEKESWPPHEVWNTLVILPKLKRDFFQKPAYTAYFNRVGVLLTTLFLLISSLIFIAWKLLRRVIPKY